MKHVIKVLIVLAVFMPFAGCATTPGEEGYHTQLGASLGAGLGAIGGQLVGGSDGASCLDATDPKSSRRCRIAGSPKPSTYY